MSSNNNDGGAAAGLGIAMAGMAIMAFFLFALAAFVALIFTMLAVLAWREPLRLGKTTVITPGEAQAFVKRGILGAILLPAFIAFSSGLLGFHVEWGYFWHMVLGGYTAGSLGVGLLMALDEDNKVAAPVVTPETLPAPPVRTMEAQPEPFRFASWDDEEPRA